MHVVCHKHKILLQVITSTVLALIWMVNWMEDEIFDDVQRLQLDKHFESHPFHISNLSQSKKV